MTRKEKNEKAKQLIHDICGFDITIEHEDDRVYYRCGQDVHEFGIRGVEPFGISYYAIDYDKDLADNFARMYANDIYDTTHFLLEETKKSDDHYTTLQGLKRFLTSIGKAQDFIHGKINTCKEFMHACKDAGIIDEFTIGDENMLDF